MLVTRGLGGKFPAAVTSGMGSYIPGDDPGTPKAGGGGYAHVVPEDYKRKRREINMRLFILLAASDY